MMFPCKKAVKGDAEHRKAAKQKSQHREGAIEIGSNGFERFFSADVYAHEQQKVNNIVCIYNFSSLSQICALRMRGNT